MSQMHKKTLFCISEDALQELRCGYCSRFLSSGPLCVLSDGRSICGRCVKENGNRVFALEAILKKCCFPCNFYQSGCKELLEFDKALEHEEICSYRSSTCPLLQYVECEWKGPTGKFMEHCLNTHRKYISNNFVFKLDVDKNSDDIIIYTKDKVTYIAKYNYESSKKLLKYDVRHCTSQNICAHFNVQISNNQDHDCSVNLKLEICREYDEQFTSLENNYLLDLNKYLGILENPCSVVLTFSTCQKNVPQAHSETRDFDVLKTLKCGKCWNYLILPIYDLDEDILCSDCGKENPDCKLSNNNEVKALVADIKYPCRWRECKSVVKSDQFKNHELQCEYRNYNCFYSGCEVNFKLNSAIKHMEAHGATYMPDGITYNTKFERVYTFKHLFTIKENVIILIQHNVLSVEDHLIHRIALFSTNSNYTGTYTMAEVDFEHNHCKIKSKPFLLKCVDTLDISFKEMPICFKNNEELLVTINLLT